MNARTNGSLEISNYIKIDVFSCLDKAIRVNDLVYMYV